MTQQADTDFEAAAAKEAILTIIARIEGVWDHPLLAKFGPIGSTMDDVLHIARSVGLEDDFVPADDDDETSGPRI